MWTITKGANSLKKQTLTVIDGETLMDARLAPTRFCVDTLLPQGLSILAGAPKLGKSWLVLDLCVKVAKGEDFLGQKTHKGTTLYLCLEDSLRRIQERLCNITDDVPGNVFFATQAGTMAEGLEEQIRDFAGEHPALSLVVIDTFHLIRRTDTEVSYANDYEEVRAVKRLADSLGIAILLVHHLRKMGDSDPLNKISGSTGISGATDAVFILDKSRRSADTATLCCTGRDIPYREMELRLGKEIHTWEAVSDSLDTPELLLPDVIGKLLSFMREQKHFAGSNAEFTSLFCSSAGLDISSKALKQQMNRYRFQIPCGDITGAEIKRILYSGLFKQGRWPPGLGEIKILSAVKVGKQPHNGTVRDCHAVSGNDIVIYTGSAASLLSLWNVVPTQYLGL